MAKTKESTTQAVMTPQDIFVSVVIVLRPETDGVEGYIKELFKLLHSSYTNFEMVLIDNGTSNEELQAVVHLLSELPCIRLIRLSRQLDFDTALFAGLDVSIGDFVCTLDPATDPVVTVTDLVEKNRYSDVVQGVSKIPIASVFGTQLGRRLFYWYNRKYLGIDIPLNATYYASYSRRAVNSLTASTNRYQRHVRHMARRVGFSYTTYDYKPLQNPSSQRKLRTGVMEALEIVASYSTHPLRFVTWLGVIAGAVNVLYAFYVLALNLLGKNLTPGWTSTSMQLSLMFFILFIVLIILSEYIGRILIETHREPSYLVLDELTSEVAVADTSRKNVDK